MADEAGTQARGDEGHAEPQVAAGRARPQSPAQAAAPQRVGAGPRAAPKFSKLKGRDSKESFAAPKASAPKRGGGKGGSLGLSLAPAQDLAQSKFAWASSVGGPSSHNTAPWACTARTLNAAGSE